MMESMTTRPPAPLIYSPGHMQQMGGRPMKSAKSSRDSVALETHNDVPMQGDGFYNSNSALQEMAMIMCLPLLDYDYSKSQVPAAPLFSVVEYGSAQGNNSIEPMRHILRGRYKKIAPQPNKKDNEDTSIPRQACLIFDDRRENDFTTLASTISKADWAHPTAVSSGLWTAPEIFTAMVPQSFYRRVLPSNSVDFGYSFATLHHLEGIPSGFHSAKGPTEKDTEMIKQSILRSQAHEDLVKFLSLRSEELRPGSPLVLSFVARSSTGILNYPSLIHAAREALISMVVAGQVSSEAAKNFFVPTYERTLDDVKEVLEGVPEVMNSWEVKDLFEKEITHPAFNVLKKEQNSMNEKSRYTAIDHEEAHAASKIYADAVVDWMMAVVSGYLIKAIQSTEPNLDPSRGEALLKEWSRRAKDIFLRDNKDEKVTCWFIYVRLIRRQQSFFNFSSYMSYVSKNFFCM